MDMAVASDVQFYSKELLTRDTPPQLPKLPYVPKDQMLPIMQDMHLANTFATIKKNYHETIAEYHDEEKLCWQWEQLCKRVPMKLSYGPYFVSPINSLSLPQDLDELCRVVSAITGWPYQTVLLVIINYICAAARGRYRVKINEQWSEPVVLYSIGIAQPSKNKSLVHSILSPPFEEYQSRLMNSYARERESVKDKESMLKRTKKKAQNEILKDSWREMKAGSADPDFRAFFESVESKFENLENACGWEIHPLESPQFLQDAVMR